MANAVINYFISAKEELKKVTWPTRDEVVQKTILVVIISLIVALYLGFLDYFLNIGLELIV